LISFEIQLIPLLSILAIARMLFLLFKNLSIFFRSPKHKCIYVLIFLFYKCSASKVNLHMPVTRLNIIGEPDILSLGTKQIYENNRRYKYFDENRNPKQEFIEHIFERMSQLFDRKYPDIVAHLRSKKDEGLEHMTSRHFVARAMVTAAKKFATSNVFKAFFEKYFNSEVYAHMLAHCDSVVFQGEHSQQYKRYRKFFSSLIFETHSRESEFVKRLDDFQKIQKNYKRVMWYVESKEKAYLYIHKRLFQEANKLCRCLEERTGVSKKDIFSNRCTVSITQCRGIILMYFKEKYPTLPVAVLTSFVDRKRKHTQRWNALYKRYTSVMSKTDEAKNFFQLHRKVLFDME